MSSILRLVRLAITALIILSCLGMATTAMAAERLVFTQLLHRHGARYPLAKANASTWCPRDGASCGLLLEEGKGMLVSLGKYLRQRYGAAYFGGSDRYVDQLDAGRIYTRSTAVPRTLQSADGVLRGMFPDTDAYFPVVNNINKNIDALLYMDAWPAFALWTQHGRKTFSYQEELRPLVEYLFPDPKTVLDLAEEAHYQGFCAEQRHGALCLGGVQDIAASLNAQGKLDPARYPNMVRYYGQLGEVRRAMRRLMFRYEPARNPLDVARGSWQTLPQAYIKAMRDAMAGKLGAMKFIHYSAHDDTTGPFARTIGDPDDLPPFAKMYLIDFVEEDGKYYVRGVQGHPEQTPGDYPYTVTPVQIGGITEDGRTHYLLDGTSRMPFEDFVRYVDSSKGTDPLAMCLVEAAVVKGMGCDKLNAAPSHECMLYRANCPMTACPTGSVLRYSDYACVQ